VYEDVGSKSTEHTIRPEGSYSREEAAAALGVNLSTLKQLINAGYLRVKDATGSRRILIEGESILTASNQLVPLFFIERQA
jgi:hypothetical protein